MVGHPMGKAGADIRDAHNIDQEVGEFMHPGYQRLHLLEQSRFIHKQVGIEHLDHAGARTRGNHERRTWSMRIEQAHGQFPRVAAHAFIERGLAAAKRLASDIDAYPEPLEDSSRRRNRGGKEFLPKASGKQRNLVHTPTFQTGLQQRSPIITTYNSFGPWTPITIRFSMSAVRLGPVTITIGCAAMVCGPTARRAAASSGSMRLARSSTTLVGGRSDRDRGRVGWPIKTRVPVGAIA